MVDGHVVLVIGRTGPVGRGLDVCLGAVKAKEGCEISFGRWMLRDRCLTET